MKRAFGCKTIKVRVGDSISSRYRPPSRFTGGKGRCRVRGW